MCDKYRLGLFSFFGAGMGRKVSSISFVLKKLEGGENPHVTCQNQSRGAMLGHILLTI